MLELRNITKTYFTGGEEVHALKGVDMCFRESEFVSILGSSGCGKTTLLNIMGGLDHYTSGDLIINGVSTKEYKDADWDAYRNNSIGFVFQSYNLIPHQTVLANVELALTLSGVSESERRERAVSALNDVGLGDQLNKKPSQMSGGQMQRVAIARALINNPDILLADEPTGALDTETSLQIMELLKTIARDRLVIMVTHNPELAEAYSTRIIRLKDGLVIGDSNPFTAAEDAEASGKSRLRNRSMSRRTALGLSFNNLMTKKARTLLTSFAGSIGIIGIALILSVSAGFQNYIDKIENDTLSSYPFVIQTETADMSSMMTAFSGYAEDRANDNGRKVTESQMMAQMFANIGSNDLASFKKYLEANEDDISHCFNDIVYDYGITPQIYLSSTRYGAVQVNPSVLMNSQMGSMMKGMGGNDIFFSLSDNARQEQEKFTVVYGKWPEKYNELVLVLDSKTALNDYMSYSLGLRDPREMTELLTDVMSGKDVDFKTGKPLEWTYKELSEIGFSLIDSSDLYEYDSTYDVYKDKSSDEKFMESLVKKGEKLKITCIAYPNKDNAGGMVDPGIGYLPSLTDYVIEKAKDSPIVKKQLADKDRDVFSGKTFKALSKNEDGDSMGFDSLISVDEKKLASAFGGKVSEKDIMAVVKKYSSRIEGNITADISLYENELSADVSKLCTMVTDDIIESAAGDTAYSSSDKAPSDSGDETESSGETDTTADGDGGSGGVASDDSSGDSSGGSSGDYGEGDKSFALSSDEIDKSVSKVLSSKQFASMCRKLSKMTGGIVNKDACSQMLGPIVSGYGTMLKQFTSKTGGYASEAMLKSLNKGYTESGELKEGIEKLAQTLTEIVMKATILTDVGKLTGEVSAEMAKAFNVNPSAIASAFQFNMSDDDITKLVQAMSSGSTFTTCESNLQKLGYADYDKPSSISFYLKDFRSKEEFLNFLDGYNDKMEAAGKEESVISYTDVTGVMMKSVKTITNAVSYVLIAFVAISLIVSSIMIGIITYISVLERTKEIGILRAIGASKKDISRVFNSETVVVGLCAGLMGILITLLLLIPINAVLLKVTGIAALKAGLPVVGAVVLVFISVLLTFIAGLIPSGMAARKDPVEALRTE